MIARNPPPQRTVDSKRIWSAGSTRSIHTLGRLDMTLSLE
jgi:hypothetical protein